MTPTPKRRGRPPLDPEAPSVSVSVRLVAKHYDAICARAGHDRRSLPDTIRRALTEHFALKNRRGA
jgi:hypothetical protein